jgi:hypothetical protein
MLRRNPNFLILLSDALERSFCGARAIVRHKVWSNSEQLPVEEFRMSRRRLGPGERADGVLVFERPSFKQSNETVLLQMADSGAVDRPALAPIGFGISTFRKEGGE